MAIREQQINPENDLGFGPQPVIKNQPLINKDGSVNIVRKGLSFFNTADNFHNLIKMSWSKFWLMILSGYLLANLLFATIYFSIGANGLYGATGTTASERFSDAFFFSAQTISTVGYGHVSPKSVMANSVAAIESMIGLLAFALATGLLYGRFSQPSAKIVYSNNLLVSPYKDGGRGLMFRIANLRRNVLIDLNVELIFSYNVIENGTPSRRFFPLELERREVSVLTLNWTIVHPLDKNSPLADITAEELERTDASFSVLLKAFDDTFSQTVHSRTSYQYNDIIWDNKFEQMFDRDADGRIVLDMSKISNYKKIN